MDKNDFGRFFEVNDNVYLKNFSKFSDDKYVPEVIRQHTGPSSFLIEKRDTGWLERRDQDHIFKGGKKRCVCRY